MSIAIGGNDSTNSLATIVGSGALSLRSAVLLGAFGEWLGASLLANEVEETIREDVAEVDNPASWACGYCNSQMDRYPFGMIIALCSAAAFLLMVTFWSFPVSCTHAVVGSVCGITIAGIGWKGLNWKGNGLILIAAGWVFSPLLAGLLGSAIYVITYYGIMQAPDPKRAALRSLPILYGLSVASVLLATLLTSNLLAGIALLPKYATALGALVVTTGLVHFVMVPSVSASVNEAEAQRMLQEASGKTRESLGASMMSAIYEPLTGTTISKPFSPGMSPMSPPQKSQSWPAEAPPAMDLVVEGAIRHPGGKLTNPYNAPSSSTVELSTMGTMSTADEMSIMETASDTQILHGPGLSLFTPSEPNREQVVAKLVFKHLIILTGFLSCFGHGANDAANVTGPLVAVQLAYDRGIYACERIPAPLWLSSMVGFFLGLGVITLGSKLINTLEADFSDFDCHVGFCVELGSAAAVLIATILGLPISTTHCQVGSVFFVAATAYGPNNLAWSLFRRVGMTWLATIPVAATVSWLLYTLMFA